MLSRPQIALAAQLEVVVGNKNHYYQWQAIDATTTLQYELSIQIDGWGPPPVNLNWKQIREIQKLKTTLLAPLKQRGTNFTPFLQSFVLGVTMGVNLKHSGQTMIIKDQHPFSKIFPRVIYHLQALPTFLSLNKFEPLL